MYRFYSQQSILESQSEVLLDKDEGHHCKHVLRLVQGQEVELFNHNGQVARGTLNYPNKKTVIIHLDKVWKTKRKKSGLEIVLWASKEKAMVFALQKGTEIGVEAFSIIQGEYSGKQYPAMKKKYQGVLIAACKQSKQDWIPRIQYYKNLEDYQKETCKKSDQESRAHLICDPSSQQQLKRGESYWEYQNIRIYIGPEAGFSEDEKEQFKDNQELWKVSLGSRILRLETAVAYMASIWMYEKGIQC